MNYIKHFYIIIFTISMLFTNTSCAQLKNDVRSNIKPKVGLIEDEKTAIEIAKVILFSVYGEKIYQSTPFKAKLIENNTIWKVKGTLNYDRGGVPFIEFQSKDCKVIRFGHGK